MKSFLKLTFLLFSLFSISQFSFANEDDDIVCITCSAERAEEIKQSNKAYRQEQIKEIRDFMARDNALTQKFVKDKNSKPFIDYADDFEKIEDLNEDLWAKQMGKISKETVAEMIKAEENFIKNLDIKWDLAKKRGYFNLEKVTPVFEGKRARNETKLAELKQKLARL